MSDQSGHAAAGTDESAAASADGRPTIPSRRDRLVAFLSYNRDRLVVDAAILLAWILATGLVFQWFGLPRWLHYMVLFLGIVVYSRSTPTWERPYRPPE